jgi:limonene-1,2-epoxide hydrolase
VAGDSPGSRCRYREVAGADQQVNVADHENVTVQQAGDDVYVEQMSTIIDGDGTHVSMVCHIFSVVDGVISGVRGYRNERGIPAG